MNVDHHHRLAADDGGSATVQGNGQRKEVNVSERAPPPPAVRSRWSPKPEQILILESIFNSGMVNPPKEETVRIRKLLERFGSVGDANVFYWFQNRRSRTRRRQRQQMQSSAGIQAAAICKSGFQIEKDDSVLHPQASMIYSASSSTSLSSPTGLSLHPPASLQVSDHSVSASINASFNSVSTLGSSTLPADDYEMYPQPIDQSLLVPSSIFISSSSSSAHYQSELITVLINGVVTEVPRGPLDIRAFFREDVILVDSSGDPVPVDGYGVSVQGLQPGETYFLIPRST